MTSYQLKTQTIYCGDNLKMLSDITDEREADINLITVASLLKAEQYKK